MASTSPSFALVINSYSKNGVALDILLASLRAQPRWKTTQCYVVVGGHEAYSTTLEDDHVRINVPYNMYDYTSFLAIVDGQVPQADYYFYIHDTTVTGETFLDKVYGYLDAIICEGYNAMRIPHGPSMNIGFYKRTALLTLLDFIRGVRTDESDLQQIKSLNVQLEDRLFAMIPRCGAFPSGVQDVSEPIDYYKTGTLRIVESYPMLDMIKIKANWNTKPVWELRL